MTDLSKKSLFIIFVKENCISTLGQKSINHPKKMQFGNVNFHRIHIVKISLFFKTKFAFFKVSWLTKFTNTEPFFYKLHTPKKIWFWTFFFRLKFFLKGYFIIKYLESWFELWKKALGYCQSPRKRNSVHINWDYSSFLEMMFCEQQLHFLSTYCKLEVTHRS